MAGLVPFNRRSASLLNSGFGDLSNMLDDFFSDWPAKRTLTMDTFKIDVQDGEKEYIIDAEVPGVKKEEISVEVNDGRLTIAVQREDCNEDTGKNYLHRERRYCSMSRSVYLADAQAEGIKAKLNDGVLNIVVPKVDVKSGALKVDIE